ncbi:hypothetical protein [Streptomyces mirabilis]|uniref:hypothetical protein n=1 Tax=Streptomyces mirabilis TaxID=68239 RepID=UPI0022562046|nr:hypothetical protein [Streptomyces mirabilis]MCX4617659.1 hypothetical protein [Streptomyces mirabilis]
MKLVGDVERALQAQPSAEWAVVHTVLGDAVVGTDGSVTEMIADVLIEAVEEATALRIRCPSILCPVDPYAVHLGHGPGDPGRADTPSSHPRGHRGARPAQFLATLQLVRTELPQYRSDLFEIAALARALMPPVRGRAPSPPR